jgi:TPR repeat protein
VRRIDSTLRAALIAAGLTACAQGQLAATTGPTVTPRVAERPTSPEDAAGDLAEAARACDRGSAVDCNALGLVYLEGRSGAPVLVPRAAELFEHGCDLRLPAACTNLGFLFREGIGVPKDAVRAIGLLTRGCDGSAWDACKLLGDIYAEGEHEDLPLAFKVVERACGAGHQPSCVSAGSMLWLGKGVPKDTVRAASLLEKACGADAAIGCTILGNVLLSGDGVSGDIEHVRSVYEQGCTANNPLGCYVFGIQCATGKLGPEYVERGEPALGRACEAKNANACAALEKVHAARGRRVAPNAAGSTSPP